MMWTMKCLLCPPDEARAAWRDLVAIQEHVMRDHGYTRMDLRWNTRRPASPNKDHYIWTMPDGSDWLEAKKEGGSSEGIPEQQAPAVPALRADDAAPLPANVRRSARLRSAS
jgi:hypothetical protein